MRGVDWVFWRADLPDYWEWVASAMFMLLTVDLITTVYAIKVVGLNGESNPKMAWLLTQPLIVIIAVHIAAVVAVAAFFYAYQRVSEKSESHGTMMLQAAKAYLIGLVGFGFVVFVNNLVVIFFERSLIAYVLSTV